MEVDYALAELADGFRSETLPDIQARVDRGDDCKVCGHYEYETELCRALLVAESCEIACPQNSCDGELSLTECRFKTVGGIPVTLRESWGAECPSCGRSVNIQDVLDREVTEELVRYEISVENVRCRPMAQHHTSYVPEQTMRVCTSCHSKIHHTRGEYTDLEPDMKRAEWEKQE